ncbi:MAG: protein-L-isoaspartate O-methyltransferase, partial [Caulobacteraceae bacterium]
AEPAGLFDLIVCEGAVGAIPQAWAAALARAGRLAAVERDGPVGRGLLLVNAAGVVGRRALFDSTPPVLAGFATERGFVF